MDLQDGGYENMRGERVRRDGSVEHVARHSFAFPRSARMTRPSASAAAGGMSIVPRMGEQPANCRLEHRIRREASSIERRHAECARSLDLVGLRQFRPRQARLDLMLRIGQAGQEEQIGLERAPFGQRRETPGAREIARRGPEAGRREAAERRRWRWDRAEQRPEHLT